MLSAPRKLMPGPAPLLIAVISILLFLPFHAVMPRPGLDASFVFAMNQAVAQGLTFGKDVIFTAGPLASIWSKAYHPATISLAVAGGTLFAIGHVFLARVIARSSHRAWAWVYAVFLILLLESRDALFLAYPVILSVVVYRMSLPPSHDDCVRLSRSESAWLIAAILPLGLLPLIKLSFLPIMLAACVLGVFPLWGSGFRLIAGSLLLVPLASALLFWGLAGQDFAALPDYGFFSTAPIVSGFAQAMGTGTQVLTPVLFVVASVVALLRFWRTRPNKGLPEYCFLLCILGFLFLSFKTGFVRQDVHALTASSGLVFVAIVLGSLRTIPPRRLPIVLLISLATWGYIHLQNKGSKFDYYRPLGSQLLAEARVWRDGNGGPFALQDRYQIALDDIQRAIPLPRLQGTVDTYPFEITALIASGNAWSPRPVIQSYSAYTPALAALNVRHLSGPRAPDHILFGVETIDNRYPSLDDGASWPELLNGYEPAGEAGKYLLLARRPAPSAPNLAPLLSRRVRLGEAVQTGPRLGVAYATVEFSLTMLGRVASLAYRPTALTIAVELSDGSKREHRLVPGQAASGFLLSPYIGSTDDFARMLRDRAKIDTLPSVDGLRISEVPRETGLWEKEYSLKLYRLEFAVGGKRVAGRSSVVLHVDAGASQKP